MIYLKLKDYGTEFKLNINIEPLDDITMDDYDFTVELSTMQKSLKYDKSQLIRQDKNNYTVLVNTEEIGLGSLRCKVTANIPDTDFEDGFRTEVVIINPEIHISKAI